MTPDESAARGERAKQILNDPMVREALDEMERAFTLAWQASPYADTEGRENCYRQIRTIRSFARFFEDVIAEGEVAAHRLKQGDQ